MTKQKIKLGESREWRKEGRVKGERTKGMGESCVSIGIREEKGKVEDMRQGEKDKIVPSSRFSEFKRIERRNKVLFDVNK